MSLRTIERSQSASISKWSILFGFLMWGIAAVFYGLDYLQHTIPSVLIQPISQEMGVSYIHIANIMSIYFPIYAIAQIPAGYLMDKYGMKIVLSLSCLIVTIGLVLMVLPISSAILVGRILIAIGSATAFVGALKAASTWVPEKHFPLMVGITQTIGVIGGLMGQVFINYLVYHGGWRYAIYEIAAFGLIWSLVTAFFLKNRPGSLLSSHPTEALFDESALTSGTIFEKKTELASVDKPKKSGLLTILKDKNIWLLAIYPTLMVSVVMSTFAELYDVIFLEKAFSIDAQKAAWISSFIFVGVGVGAPLHGIIAKKFRDPKTWVIITSFATMLIFALTVFSYFFSLTGLLSIILYFLLGFSTVSMLLSFSLARCSYAKDSHAMIFAFINTAIGVGGTIFPLCFGFVIKKLHQLFPYTNELLLPLFSLIVPLLIAFLLTFCIRGNQGDKRPSSLKISPSS